MEPTIKDIGEKTRQATRSGKGLAFLLIALSFFAYVHSFSNGFLTDDYNFLDQKYQDIFKTTQDFFIKVPPKTHHYAPLYYWTNILFFRLFHAYPFLLRFVIWLVFLANVLLFFKIINILTRDERKSFLCCALFAIHPIHAFYIHMPSANFVFFYTLLLQASLLCVWMYLTSATKNTGYYFASLLCFFISLLFFEAAALYPLYLLIFIKLINKNHRASHVKFLLPFFILSLIDVFIWLRLCRGESNFMQRILLLDLSFPSYIASVTRLIFRYISQLIYPEGIVFIYNVPLIRQGVWMWNGLAALLLIFFLFLTHRQPKGITAPAIAWFCTGGLFVFPASLTHAYMGLVIESHWMYFSSIGLFLIFASGLVQVLDKLRPFVKYACLGFVALYFISWTQTYHLMARSEKSYCEYWLRVCPENLIPLITLSKIYAEEGRLDQAVDYAQRALTLGHTCIPKTYENLATFLTLKGDYAQAEAVIARALQKGFSSAYLLNTLGVIHLQEGDSKTAEQDFLKAIKRAPHYFSPRLNLADVYRSSGEDKKAVQQYEDALTMNPDANQLFYIKVQLLVLYLNQNQMDQYQRTIQELLAQNPQPRTYLRLSHALEKHHYCQEAHALLKQAVEHYPGDTSVEQFSRDFIKRCAVAR
ncbi:MAG: tetratricopeptide repeat protein [Candidatus Omnitrophota bacterium]|jgi:Tfp pilus assembly protein PilF